MRSWTTFSLAAVAALCLLVPLASTAHAAGIPILGYAALRHHEGAPQGKRFSVQLFTKYAHAKNGDQVYARARRPHESVYARENGKNNGWDVWHITTKTRDGRRLIRELRRQMKHGGTARFKGILHAANAIGDCPVRFKIRKYDKAYAGKPLTCAQ